MTDIIMKLIFLLFSVNLTASFHYVMHPEITDNQVWTNATEAEAAADSISIIMPVTRIVYQRNNKNKALIRIQGTVPQNTTAVEARLVARASGQGTTTRWKTFTKNSTNNAFSGLLEGLGGWYDLEVRARNGKQMLAASVTERVGIGEVFVIAGHSVAQGGDINIEGSADDRVSTVPLQEKSERFQTYLKTGDPQYLPEPKFVQAATGVAHAPFGHNNYFWSKFGEHLARKENVPVLIFNAGFGGTNLEHWAKASQFIGFEHGFVKSAIRMPYINLFNTWKKYIPLTGVRAILADHGQNDQMQKSADTILKNYRIFMRQARTDLRHDRLALVVNRQTPKGAPAVRIAQNRMAAEPDCFLGPDYDLLLKDDTVDGIHLSASGAAKAALMWTQALTPRFFSKSRPWLPAW